MKRIVVNSAYGGFGLSVKAEKFLMEHSEDFRLFYHLSSRYDISLKPGKYNIRKDPVFIDLLLDPDRTFAVSVMHANLSVYEYPEELDDVLIISEYDGYEHIDFNLEAILHTKFMKLNEVYPEMTRAKKAALFKLYEDHAEKVASGYYIKKADALKLLYAEDRKEYDRIKKLEER